MIVVPKDVFSAAYRNYIGHRIDIGMRLYLGGVVHYRDTRCIEVWHEEPEGIEKL